MIATISAPLTPVVEERSVLDEPGQSLCARLKHRKLTAREFAQVFYHVFREHGRDLRFSRQRGFLDIGFVKDRSFFHNSRGFRVKRCPAEVGKYQHRSFWMGHHQIGNSPENLFHLARRAICQVYQEDLLSLIEDDRKTLAWSGIRLPLGR